MFNIALRLLSRPGQTGLLSLEPPCSQLQTDVPGTIQGPYFVRGVVPGIVAVSRQFCARAALSVGSKAQAEHGQVGVRIAGRYSRVWQLGTAGFFFASDRDVPGACVSLALLLVFLIPMLYVRHFCCAPLASLLTDRL